MSSDSSESERMLATISLIQTVRSTTTRLLIFPGVMSKPQYALVALTLERQEVGSSSHDVELVPSLVFRACGKQQFTTNDEALLDESVRIRGPAAKSMKDVHAE